jgi:hypothetical protein
VDAEKLARLPAAVAEAGEDLEGVAQDDIDLFVLAVGQVDVFLPDLSGAMSTTRRSVRCMSTSFTKVPSGGTPGCDRSGDRRHNPSFDSSAQCGGSELLRGRSIWIVAAERRVVGLFHHACAPDVPVSLDYGDACCHTHQRCASLVFGS